MSSELLLKEFQSIQADLIEAYDKKGMRASGDFANSLEVQINGLNAKILGNDYAQQLETGRLAGKSPPISAITKWINDKGIAGRIEGKISIKSLAFLIARKISREGWNRQGYGGVELISEVITDERMQSIISKFGDAYVIEQTSEIIKQIKQLV
jgi:hypothetical protein